MPFAKLASIVVSLLVCTAHATTVTFWVIVNHPAHVFPPNAPPHNNLDAIAPLIGMRFDDPNIGDCLAFDPSLDQEYNIGFNKVEIDGLVPPFQRQSLEIYYQLPNDVQSACEATDPTRENVGRPGPFHYYARPPRPYTNARRITGVKWFDVVRPQPGAPGVPVPARPATGESTNGGGRSRDPNQAYPYGPRAPMPGRGGPGQPPQSINVWLRKRRVRRQPDGLVLRNATHDVAYENKGTAEKPLYINEEGDEVDTKWLSR
ncbi:MAG: hypothetical protein M1833_005766 [Piccolia ochrophora]|nr:MAG: hypothetical protein M1833_005766 [Piccolia ochrophora]